MQSTQIYLDTVRECYEAFVIYSFFMYLLAYLEDEYGDISVYLSTKEEVSHMWGVQWIMKPWRMGDDFMWQCKKVRFFCGLLGSEHLHHCSLCTMKAKHSLRQCVHTKRAMSANAAAAHVSPAILMSS